MQPCLQSLAPCVQEQGPSLRVQRLQDESGYFAVSVHMGLLSRLAFPACRAATHCQQSNLQQGFRAVQRLMDAQECECSWHCHPKGIEVMWHATCHKALRWDRKL